MLVSHAEMMFLTGKPSWPIERNLLTTGAVAAAVAVNTAAAADEAGGGGVGQMETPHLRVEYTVGPEQIWGGLGEPDETKRLFAPIIATTASL